MAARLLMTSLFAVLLLVPPQADARANDGPELAKAFISDLSEQAIQSLTSPDIARDVRLKRFRAMVDEYFAGQAIARFVLGRSNWRRATEEQREEYLVLFEKMIVERYVDSFANYSGETLNITGVDVRSEQDYLVETQLERPGATQAVKVVWRLRRAKTGEFKVVDIFVNGLSLSVTQQKEFSAVIRNNGNSIDALLVTMRDIIEKQQSAVSAAKE